MNQNGHHSSTASMRSTSSSAKPTLSTQINNNVVKKKSTTNTVASNRPESTTPVTAPKPNKSPTQNTRHATQPPSAKPESGINSTAPANPPPPPLARQNQQQQPGNQAPVKEQTSNVQKIILTSPPQPPAPAVSTNPTVSAKSTTSSKLRVSTGPNTINNTSANNAKTVSDLASNHNNANQAETAAVGSNVANTIGATQNASQKPQIKIPLPQPIPQIRNNVSTLTRSTVRIEKSRNFRTFVEKAINEHKIFSCFGVYPAVKNALKRRGWVEKPGPLAYTRSANVPLTQGKSPEDESDIAWMARVLKDIPPDFWWVIRRDNIEWKNITREQLINRFPKAWFTTKVGIAASLQHMHWFSEAGVSDTFFPRCYRLCLEEERLAFQDDYRLTACMSYLRYFVETYDAKGHTSLADVHSKITPLSVDFAARQLGNYIRMRKHEDIDWLLPPNFMTQHWDAFIHQYYAVVQEKKKLRFDNPEAVQVKYETAKKMLNKIAQYWPQHQLDGVYNMWICKPGARSRGKGIVIMNNMEKIMDLLSQSNFRECNWVVQKYIEKPMLIYKTKFDMRQWFLVTDWTPLTIWFYKESYVRFCTKPFNLEDFHESIHLCNNAIQCRYQNSDQRDSNLPEENMWSSDTFQAYLKTIGRLDAWPLIYSGMKQAIVGVLLASQETIESRKGCFELYGADFMLTEDFCPWLIEINSCPCMSASTSVTARMCQQCLEDTIKVVVDRRNNRNADTGLFEMIYRQNVGSVLVQQFSGHDLTVAGKKLNRDIEWPMAISRSMANALKHKINSQGAFSKIKSDNNNNTTNNNVNKKTLSELLQKLRVRNQEMFEGGISVGSTSSEITAEETDAASLMEKIKSLNKSDSPDEDKSTSASTKKSSSDQKKSNTSSESSPKSNKLPSNMIEKVGSSAKGEDLASKLEDVKSSISYLMRTSHHSSVFIGDALRASNETAQEMIVRTKKLETASKKQSKEEQPVAKTLAEVRAMVESSALSNPEKNGKTTETLPFTYLSSILTQGNSLRNESVSETFQLVNSEHSLFNSKQEVTQSDSNASNKYISTIGESDRKSESKDSLAPFNSDRVSFSPRDNYFDTTEWKRFDEFSSLKSLFFPTEECKIHHVHQDKELNAASHQKETIEVGASSSYKRLICNNDSKENFGLKSKCNITNDINTDELAQTEHQNETDNRKAIAKEVKITHTYVDNEKKINDKDIQSSLPSCNKLTTAVMKKSTSTPILFNKEDSFGGVSLSSSEMYRSILLNSMTPSSSDSESDFNNNELILTTPNFTPALLTLNSFDIGQDSTGKVESGKTEIVEYEAPPNSIINVKPKPVRHYYRRSTISSSARRCSKRYPCYRVILEPQNYQQQRYILNNKRKSGPTLPMKTVNLLLPSNFTFY